MWTGKSKIPLIALFAALIFSAPFQSAPADKRKPGLYWTLETDKGKIACKLYETEAPVTVRTMVGLAIVERVGPAPADAPENMPPDTPAN